MEWVGTQPQYSMYCEACTLSFLLPGFTNVSSNTDIINYNTRNTIEMCPTVCILTQNAWCVSPPIVVLQRLPTWLGGIPIVTTHPGKDHRALDPLSYALRLLQYAPRRRLPNCISDDAESARERE